MFYFNSCNSSNSTASFRRLPDLFFRSSPPPPPPSLSLHSFPDLLFYFAFLWKKFSDRQIDRQTDRQTAAAVGEAAAAFRGLLVLVTTGFLNCQKRSSEGGGLLTNTA